MHESDVNQNIGSVSREFHVFTFWPKKISPALIYKCANKSDEKVSIRHGGILNPEDPNSMWVFKVKKAGKYI